MRYQLSEVSPSAVRLLTDPRRWLLEAARGSASVPSEWARGITPRRAMVVAELAGVALGAGIAGQTTAVPAGYQNAIEVQGSAAGSVAEAVPVSTPMAPATNSIAQLERPGYALPNTTAASLNDVGASLSDVATLQRLQAQILSPAASNVGGSTGGDLAQLIRAAQAGVALPGSTSSAPVDVTAVEGAVAEVRAAQAGLLAATKARDSGTSAPVVAPVGLPIAPSAIAPAPAATAAASATTTASTSASPAVIHDVQARLTTAQQQLQAAQAGPNPAQVNQAEQTIAQALAATPQAPGESVINDAQAAVDRAQKSVDAALQAQSSAARATASPSVVSRAGAITVNPSAGAPPSVDAGAARAAASVDGPSVVGTGGERLADSLANLASAKATLADLQQRAAYAANPESQPAVVQARQQLAQLQVPPDATAVAQSQAVVTSLQTELARLQGQAAGVTAAASSPIAAASSVASATVAPAAASSAGAAAAPAGSGDGVAAAEQQLAQAQARLQALVAPGSAPSPTLAPASALPPTGPDIVAATSSSLPPLVTAAATDGPLLPAAAQSQTAAPETAELSLRAHYIADVALLVAHLHPSALPAGSATTALARLGTPTASPALAWPVSGPITQPFGVPELGVGSPHTGIDIGVPIGTPVRAAAAGVVTFAGGDPSSGYGYYVILDHGTGISTLYGHFALPPFLRPGQFVSQNAVLGISGSTGMSTGPHVHFEVRLSGTPMDPQRLLPVLRSLPQHIQP